MLKLKMSLSRFSVIVATDDANGIAHHGTIPWSCPEDLKEFRHLTSGSTVVCGRVTFESMPPLPNRKIIVVSSELVSDQILVVPSLFDALKHSSPKIFIIGGQRLYEEAVQRFGYLCDDVYHHRIAGNYECDRFFPLVPNSTLDRIIKFSGFTQSVYRVNCVHPEIAYLDLLRKVMETGVDRPDRTGVGTRSLFGDRLEISLESGFPILTTKKMFPVKGVAELLFFISGSSDTKILESTGVPFWKGNTSAEFLQARGLPYPEGHMGPMYGHQWRHWGRTYGTDEPGIDQLQQVIDNLVSDPMSRRHVVSTWNVSDLPAMVIAPCHHSFQFYISGDQLDCQLSMRSADLFLGVPYNILCYALLTSIVGSLTGLKPRRLILSFGDVHIYSNHFNAVQIQLSRTPYPFPTLKINPRSKLDDIVTSDIEIKEYQSWGSISAPMAI